MVSDHFLDRPSKAMLGLISLGFNSFRVPCMFCSWPAPFSWCNGRVGFAEVLQSKVEQKAGLGVVVESTSDELSFFWF